MCPFDGYLEILMGFTRESHRYGRDRRAPKMHSLGPTLKTVKRHVPYKFLLNYYVTRTVFGLNMVEL